jgi:hypothetical protein
MLDVCLKITDQKREKRNINPSIQRSHIFSPHSNVRFRHIALSGLLKADTIKMYVKAFSL